MHILNASNFGPLETAILEHFWAEPDTSWTVAAVHDALQARGLAYTTILTTMVRMTEKGWPVARRSAVGRALGAGSPTATPS